MWPRTSLSSSGSYNRGNIYPHISDDSHNYRDEGLEDYDEEVTGDYLENTDESQSDDTILVRLLPLDSGSIGGQRPSVIAVSRGIPIDELRSCILIAVTASNYGDEIQRKPIGLRDPSTNVTFPLSFLATEPQSFSEGMFEVIWEIATPDLLIGEDQEEYVVNRLPFEIEDNGRMTLSDKIRSIRETVGFLSIDAIELHKILLLNSNTEEIITRDEFIEAMQSLSTTHARPLLNLLFGMFSDSEFAVISELVSGLSVSFIFVTSFHIPLIYS